MERQASRQEGQIHVCMKRTSGKGFFLVNLKAGSMRQPANDIGMSFVRENIQEL